MALRRITLSPPASTAKAVTVAATKAAVTASSTAPSLAPTTHSSSYYCYPFISSSSSSPSSTLPAATATAATTPRRFNSSSGKNGDTNSTNDTITARAFAESVDSDDSHMDFKPRIVPPTTDEGKDELIAIKDDIKETIADEEVVLFMKGVPEAPVCGFSKRMVDILEELGLEYTSFDCLAHPIVRTYVKELSDWPTIPQLWVHHQFVGGIDIVTPMLESGELQTQLRSHKIAFRDPNGNETKSGAN